MDNIQKKCLQFIQDAIGSTKLTKQRERAKTNQDFYRGNQYTQDEYNVYKSKGVEPITINRCRPVVKAMVGMYLQNRQSIRVRPRRGGTETVANVLTELVKHTEDNTHADYLYTDLIRRGGIDTESYIKVYIDKQQNPNGQIMFKVRSLQDIDVDPNAVEYDVNESARFVIDSEWLDQEYIQKKYPDQEDNVFESAYSLSTMDNNDPNGLISYMTDNDIQDTTTEDEQEDYELKKKRRFRIRSIYWKEVVTGLLVADKQAGLVKILTDKEQIKQIKKATKGKARFEVKDVPAYLLHETIMLGAVVLEDIKQPYGDGISDLPVFRFSPFWDLGYANGLVDDVISLNREENIHRTQSVKIMNNTVNSGWFTKGGSEQAKNSLKNYGSVDGVVIDKTQFGGEVEKIQPNPLPQGMFVMAQQFEQDIKRVSGFDDATMGYQTPGTESGRAIGLKQQQNQVSAEPVFDNFYRTLELLGNFVLKVIKTNNIYTDDEIIQTVGESDLLDMKMLEKAQNMFVAQTGAELVRPAPVMPLAPEVMMAIRPEDKVQVLQTVQNGIAAAQEYAKAYPRLKSEYDEVIKQHAILMMLQELKDDRLGQYGVTVTVSSSASTERLARFMEMDALQSKYGDLIPPDIFIDATDLPNKEEIKARIKQQMQTMQMQQQQSVQGAA